MFNHGSATTIDCDNMLFVRTKGYPLFRASRVHSILNAQQGTCSCKPRKCNTHVHPWCCCIFPPGATFAFTASPKHPVCNAHPFLFCVPAGQNDINGRNDEREGKEDYSDQDRAPAEPLLLLLLHPAASCINTAMYGILDAACIPPYPVSTLQCMVFWMQPLFLSCINTATQGILDAACIPPLPVPLRTLMEACCANAKSSKGVVQPTARDLTNHMPPDQRAPAMARIRCAENRKKLACKMMTTRIRKVQLCSSKMLVLCERLFRQEYQMR
eukprot:933434-Pelagomonas_calceolata.AAC.3